MSRRTSAAGVLRLQYSALPAYRQPFLDELVRLFTEDPPRMTWEFLVGRDQFDPTVQTAIETAYAVNIRNHYFLGRRLLWQEGITRMISAEVAVTELNPRVLSTWVWLVMRRMLGRPTLLWGHAWPRAGASSWTAPVRALMRSVAQNIVTYTDEQARAIEEKQPSIRCFVAPNALFSAADLVPVVRTARDIIYVGRLVPSKKVDLLIRGYAIAAQSDVFGYLRIVGRGPELAHLVELARTLGVAERVVFHGEVTDERELRSLYATAICSVSPGYVGLSATQSLGFGVPMVWARDEPHAPEATELNAANSVSFDSDSETDLARALNLIVVNSIELDQHRAATSEAIRCKYSAESMAAGMRQAVLSVLVSAASSRPDANA